MGELRPDTWLRPANLDGPDGDDGLVVVRGPLDGQDPAALAARLVAAADDRRRGRPRCRRRLDAMLPDLADRRPDALPPTITLAAEVVRFLRAEPLLPPALTPRPWPPDALRDRYREFDRALGDPGGAVVPERAIPRWHRCSVGVMSRPKCSWKRA